MEGNAKTGAIKKTANKNNGAEVDVSTFLRDRPNIDARKDDAPICWERTFNGYRVIDLGSDNIEEALQLIQREFFRSEPMCKSTKLHTDITSVESYLHILVTKMADLKSVCAIREGTGELVGVAVASLNLKGDQQRTETRVRPHQGQALFRVMNLKSCLFKEANIYENLHIDKYLRIHAVCVEPLHQGRGVGTALIRSCVTRTREFLIPACIGGFSSGASQTIGNVLILGERILFSFLFQKSPRYYYEISRRY
ncbi:uncharacterized protein LOC105694489 [Orussus abietinus]|uniref:uncharacterized protein LOC105694489 n=1 Tax=Orussus abietinus TaxID=222816 RepID=UPI00062596D7|nr:uncharacterized protein LOC105694489 [Orussus abietinus]XP_012270625.1 uncharacterized protein LOC105694489 [Orussus abietinus]